MKPALALLTLTLALPVRAQDSPSGGFAGRTQGDGTLRLFLTRPRPYHVESRGVPRPDGTFQLNQTVTFQDQLPRDRTWVMTPLSPTRFAATLSDAAGPVRGRRDGDQTFLRYRYKGPFVIRQTLTRLPDGRTIDNVGTITLLGVPVGRLRETIVRR